MFDENREQWGSKRLRGGGTTPPSTQMTMYFVGKCDDLPESSTI